MVNQGGEYWNNILEWGVKTGHTTPMQNSSLKIASQIPRKLPTSDIDIKRIIKAEDIAISEGFIANK